MRKLKPCPFCGSEGVRGGVGVTHHTQCKNRKCPAYAGSYHKTREDSDDVWNKRVLPLSVTLPDDPPNEALERARVIHERLKVAENLPAGGKTSPGVTLLLVTSILACEEYEQAIKDERARVEEMVDEIRGWEDTLVMGSYEESVRSVRSEMKEFLRAIKGGE